MSSVVNQLFVWLSDICSSVLTMLPKSPFTFERQAGLESFMGYLNYFIPVGKMVTTGMAWLTCIGVWYLAVIVLRWLKAIE